MDVAHLISTSLVRQVIEEEAIARNYVVNRYRTLINRKYLDKLSDNENEELEGLKTILDKMHEPYYDSIIKRLRRLIKTKAT